MTSKVKHQLQDTIEYNIVQAGLFDMECQGYQQRREIIDYVGGIRVEVYTLINTTIYWFIDVITGEDFRTRNFNDAVDALVYAVS